MRRSWAAHVTALSLLSALVATPWTVAPASAAELTPLPSVQADAVVDGYGVGIHLPFLDTPYRDAETVATALEDLGVRHVRDDLYLDNPRQYDGIRTLAGRGIRFDLIMGRPDRPGTPADYVRTVAEELPTGAVESVEGVNEWDHFGGPDWPVELVSWQQRLFDEVKGDPRTSHLPVLSPALAFRWNYAALPDLSPWSDKANAHMYPGGYKPTNEITRITDSLLAVVPGKPVVTTEAGYHNALNTAHGHRAVPEDVAGVYEPRLLLEHLLRGEERLYRYELIDSFADPGKTDPEAHFGLLRHDLSPKPAYHAMRNLIDLLEDPGPAHRTEPLPLSVKGWPSDGRYLVTQKRDGGFVLLLWRDVAVYDPVDRERSPVAPVEVTLTFGTDHDAGVHRPSEDSEPVRRVVADTLQVPLDGQVTAVTLDPPPPAPVDLVAADGDSAAVPTTVVPASVPGTPRIRSTKARKRSVTVRWRASETNGRPVKRYRLSWGAEKVRVGPDSRKVTLRGLPRRTKVRVVVQARNRVGWGPRAVARVRTG